MKHIDAGLVESLLSPAECVEIMADAMVAASAGKVHIEPRLKEQFSGGDGEMLLMRAESAELGSYAIKMINILPGNAARGLPVIQGVIQLFSCNTGNPIASVDGGAVTALRTAAASALATRELARADARSLGLLGTGVQALSHFHCIRAVRDIESVCVWGRNPERAAVLGQQLQELGPCEIRVVDTPAEAAACDIVCTLTASPEPIVERAWVQDGAHVNVVGSHSLQTREVDTALVAAAEVYVDLESSMLAEAGDIMIPVEEGAITLDHVVGEIGKVLAGDIPGRSRDSAITLYKSLGVAAQDLYAAHRIAELAES